MIVLSIHPFTHSPGRCSPPRAASRRRRPQSPAPPRTAGGRRACGAVVVWMRGVCVCVWMRGGGGGEGGVVLVVLWWCVWCVGSYVFNQFLILPAEEEIEKREESFFKMRKNTYLHGRLEVGQDAGLLSSSARPGPAPPKRTQGKTRKKGPKNRQKTRVPARPSGGGAARGPSPRRGPSTPARRPGPR